MEPNTMGLSVKKSVRTEKSEEMLVLGITY